MPSWVIFASLAMGALAFAILQFGKRFMERQPAPQSMAQWLPELEPVILRVVHKTRELAEAVHAWNSIRAKVPPEYQRVVDSVIRYAQLCEEQLHEEMVESKIPPLRSMFADLVPPDQPTMVPATIPPPAPDGIEAVDDDYAPNVVQFPSDREWVAGQLLLKRTAT